MKNIGMLLSLEQQFVEVIDIITQHKRHASRLVNCELLLTAWHVGGYVSAKLKSEEWGSKVVSQLSQYISTQRPDLKGYSRRNIYNMVMFYEEYSSESFMQTIEKYLNMDFVQSKTAQKGTKPFVEYAMSRSMSPTMIAEYKSLLIPQDRMQKLLNEYCNQFVDKE